MTAALRYELMRIRTLPSSYWVIGTCWALQLVICLFIATVLEASAADSVLDGQQLAATVMTLGASAGVAPLLVAYMVGIVGVFTMGHEYRHGMIRATLTAVPDRVAVVVAKAVVLAATAVVAALGTLAISTAVALFVLPSEQVLSGLVGEVAFGVVLYTVLFGWSAMAIAGLVRHQGAALALVLLVPSVVESVIGGVLRVVGLSGDDPGAAADIARFLPYDAGSRLYTAVGIDDAVATLTGAQPLSGPIGGVVFAVFVAVLLVSMTTTFVRRDA